MSIRDDQLHASEAATKHALEKARPKRLRFRRTDVQADDLALAVRVRGNGDYRSYRDDPAALPLFEVGGVQPQIRPFAGQWAAKEGADPLVDVLAQLDTSKNLAASAVC